MPPQSTDTSAWTEVDEPKGWTPVEDVTPAAPAAPANLSAAVSESAPAPSFSERVGERIKSQLYTPFVDILHGLSGGKPSPEQQQRAAAMTESVVGDPNASLPTKLAMGATVVPRTIYNLAKDWINDPANALGDIISGYVAHQASIDPRAAEAKPAQAKAAAPSSAEAEPRITPLTPEQQAKYTETLDKVNREHAQDLADWADKEAKARAKWVDKAYGAKQSVAEAERVANQRDVLGLASDKYTEMAKENIANTHAAVRGSLNQRWNALRDTLQGAEVDASAMHNAVEAAKAEYLRGSPANLKLFNDLVKELGVDEFVGEEGGGLQAAPGSTVDWDTARVHSSAIGDKLAGGGLPGNVYQALKAVHGAIEDQLGKTADSYGQGKQYQALRRDWSQYMKDWNDMSAVSGGGSPLARALRAADAGVVSRLVRGVAGDRLIQTLAKYKDYGAAPELTSAARTFADHAESLKPPKIRAAPGKYEAPEPPTLKEVAKPKPETPKPPTAGKMTRAVGRLTGKIVGGTVGSAVGHPLIGYGIGGEVGGDLADRLAARAAPRRTVVPPPPQ